MTRKLVKNIEGFRDHLGIFHPIRSGNKEQGRLYDAGAAGDYDFPAEREERRANNEEKAEKIYQERLLKEALDGALGDERKFTLSQFVRKSGGLKYDPTGKTTKSGKKDSWYGELAAFSFKETGKKGLAHKNGKYGVDGMREQANEAGYPRMDSESDFLDALEKDLRTGDVYPFFSADYMDNPATPENFYKGKAAEIAKAITFFKKRGKTAKANKLEKAKTIALQLAKKAAAQMKTSPKTKKRTPAKTAKKPAVKKVSSISKAAKNPTAKKTAAKKPTAKKPTAKKPTAKKPTAKKSAVKKTAAKKTATKRPRKNGVIETAAALAVGTSAAVGLFDRATKGAKVSSKPNRSAALKHNKSNAADIPFHEKEFDRLIGLIENGDMSKINSAKLQAKLAGYSQREAEELTDRARLHYRLKINPAKVNLATAQKLVHNGRLKQFFARKSAVRHYNRQIRLEQQLDRAKAKKAKAERAAKKNPSTSAATKKCDDAFYAFQGRFPTETISVLRPEDAPKRTWSVGKLLEVRLKGHPNLDFRNSRKNYYLAADMNSQQLWILGGSIASADSAITKGCSLPVGEITHLVYSTHKAHLDDIPDQGYIHKLGEEGGERPVLGRDRNGFPVIVGGDYSIEPLGIAN